MAVTAGLSGAGVVQIMFSVALFILGGVVMSVNVVGGWGPLVLGQAITHRITAARGRSPGH